MTNHDHSPDTAVQSEPAQPAPEITSRFLFVDVAAQRAKQLRRGALPRIDRSTSAAHRLERVAMEEVRRGAIHYTLPDGALFGKGRAGNAA